MERTHTVEVVLLLFLFLLFSEDRLHLHGLLRIDDGVLSVGRHFVSVVLWTCWWCGDGCRMSFKCRSGAESWLEIMDGREGNMDEGRIYIPLHPPLTRIGWRSRCGVRPTGADMT